VDLAGVMGQVGSPLPMGRVGATYHQHSRPLNSDRRRLAEGAGEPPQLPKLVFRGESSHLAEAPVG